MPIKVTSAETLEGLEPGASGQFTALGDSYKLVFPKFGVTLEIDHARRHRQELSGELIVHCTLPGVRVFNGVLSAAEFNIGSARARSERAKLLADRSRNHDIDWAGLLEEFCQRILLAERVGQPAVDLRDLARPDADDAIKIEGFAFSRRHPTMIFGDGGAAKSYTALYLAGRMVQAGICVALFDWELAGEDHRDRLERLFGLDMPKIIYARCERPLIAEADRLRRIVHDHSIDFAIYDSVAFACDGPPEAAEVAGRYFRAVREIGGGSLHIAHVNKSDNADQKPFGSTFWHNGARATWFAKLTDSDTDNVRLGFFNKKSNLGKLRPPAGFSIQFTDDHTTFRRVNVADVPELAEKLSIRQRMEHLLRHGALDPGSIAQELDGDVESVKRTVRRYKRQFTVLEGGRVALLEHRPDSPPDSPGQSVLPGGGHTLSLRECPSGCPPGVQG